MTRSISTRGITIPGIAVCTGIHLTGLLRSTMIHGITVTTTGLTIPFTTALITATVMADTSAPAEIILTGAEEETAT